MRIKSLVILVILAVVFPMASNAQQSPEKGPQIKQQQDSRTLVYVNGIT